MQKANSMNRAMARSGFMGHLMDKVMRLGLASYQVSERMGVFSSEMEARRVEGWSHDAGVQPYQTPIDDHLARRL